MNTGPRPQRPSPREWYFNDTDFEKYDVRFWRVPRRLILEGKWADLWRRGKSITSVLPVLAVHTWPGKTDLLTAQRGGAPGWTGWSYLSQRRTARLAGVDKDTATRVVKVLESEGLLEFDGAGRGGRPHYRLSHLLYPGDCEEFAQVPARLFYGGNWAMLSTPAARHLYVVISCLDPIWDEEAYLREVEDNDESWRGDVPEDWTGFNKNSIRELQTIRFLAKRRSSETASLRLLTDLSGMTRKTVRSAMRQLTTAMFGGDDGERPRPLVQSGHGSPTWYAPDRGTLRWRYTPEFLRNARRVEAKRQELWPWLYERRQQARRVSDAREAAQTRIAQLAALDTDTQEIVDRVAGGGLDAWSLAQLLTQLDVRLREARAIRNQGELAILVNRSHGSVSQLLVIAKRLTSIVNEYGFSPSGMSRAHLHRIAKLTRKRRTQRKYWVRG